MLKRPVFWLMSIAFIFSPQALSFTANGTVKGGELLWDNVFQLSGNESTLSDWTSIAGLPPTVQWSPGSVTTSSNFVTLTGASGSIEVPLSIKGMQFHVGSANPTQSDPFIVGVSCSGGDYNGSIATVLDQSGTQCSAPYSLLNNGSIAPFYFYRPIFDLDSDALNSGLKGKSAGIYSGTIPLNIVYYYVSSGGAFTYYQAQETLSFQINYIPSYLTSIEVTNGNTNGLNLGQMEAVYDTQQHTVSAETFFNIKASGYFSEGLRMDFSTQNDYMLEGINSKVTIPYSITCDDCDDVEIVKDGALRVDSTTIQAGSDLEEINFQYRVHYDDIHASVVETDTYTGSFIVIFEEVI